MKIFLECLPCLLKQALEVSKMATDDVEIHKKVMNDAIEVLTHYNDYNNAPILAKTVHDSVKKYTNTADPYKQIKDQDIETSKKLYPKLIDFLQKNNKSLKSALKISATGNIIDSAINFNIDINKCLSAELEKDFFICDISVLSEKLKTAKTLLILGDNAGETVFDKVLIENLKDLKNIDIYYAVRSEPIINDTTEYEAEKSGLKECSHVISSGCPYPGIVLRDCSKDFLQIFSKADIVISKGQGNFEALTDNMFNYKRDIFLLLKAKCNLVAKELGTDLNTYVFKYISAD